MKRTVLIIITLLLVAALLGSAALALGGIQQTEESTPISTKASEAKEQTEELKPKPTAKRIYIPETPEVVEPVITGLTPKAQAVYDSVIAKKTLSFEEKMNYICTPDYIKEMTYDEARAEEARLKKIVDDSRKNLVSEEPMQEQYMELGETNNMQWWCGVYADVIAVDEDLLEVRLRQIKHIITVGPQVYGARLKNSKGGTARLYEQRIKLIEKLDIIVKDLEASDATTEQKIKDIDTLLAYQIKESQYYGRGFLLEESQYVDYDEELQSYMDGVSIQEIFG